MYACVHHIMLLLYYSSVNMNPFHVQLRLYLLLTTVIISTMQNKKLLFAIIVSTMLTHNGSYYNLTIFIRCSLSNISKTKILSLTFGAVRRWVLEHGTLPSSAAILFLYYFAIFIHDPVPNDSNKICILSHTDVTATVETSVVSLIDFPQTKTHLESAK